MFVSDFDQLMIYDIAREIESLTSLEDLYYGK